MPSRDREDSQSLSRRSGGLSKRTNDPFSDWSGMGSLDPFAQFRRLSDQMDRWFDAFGMGRPGNRMSSQGMGLWSPQLETFLRDDQLVIRVDLPGMNKDDVNVEVTEQSVIIHGEREHENKEEREGYYRSERSYGRFYREVPLPEGALTETAQANFRDGVLEVSIQAPPREVSQPRRVAIGGATEGERKGESRQERSSASSREQTEKAQPQAVAHDKESQERERKSRESDAKAKDSDKK
jgi:HSP20 family protein